MRRPLRLRAQILAATLPSVPDANMRDAAKLAAMGIGEDVALFFRTIFVHWIAGSPLLPRPFRFVLYRAMGFRFKTPVIGPHQTFHTRKVVIGARTVVGAGCLFEGRGHIEIGSDVMVGPGVTFVTSTHLGDGVGGIDRFPVSRRVSVLDRAWVGARATLLPGARVGEGCVVGAGSVVSGDCEPGYVYIGVPARRIGRVDALPTELPDAVRHWTHPQLRNFRSDGYPL